MYLWCMSCVFYCCCFRLVTTLVASHDVWKLKSGCLFRMRFYPKLDLHFWAGAGLKMIFKIGSLKITSFGSVRFANRFRDPKTFIFELRNGVIMRWPDSRFDVSLSILLFFTGLVFPMGAFPHLFSPKTEINCRFINFGALNLVYVVLGVADLYP